MARRRAASRPPGSVRIIGGRWRGRRVSVPDVRALRPTADRIRETLFNWLTGRVAGSRIADLFAGTGILGLEALSRGAARAVFVERDRRLADGIEDHLREYGCGDARVISEDAYDWLARGVPEPFDIVFLDPPYSHGRVAELCTLLADRGWLASDALVYLEYDRRTPPEMPPSFFAWREKTAGNVRFLLLERGDQAVNGEEE
ncbi:MAG: 16S rRNA (guanine(966)-N(2))-methyltransferase RsmD [Gammaproteobacteria bacterium]